MAQPKARHRGADQYQHQDIVELFEQALPPGAGLGLLQLVGAEALQPRLGLAGGEPVTVGLETVQRFLFGLGVPGDCLPGVGFGHPVTSGCGRGEA